MVKDFHIFIASCWEGVDSQVPRLIKNILEVELPTQYVHIIIGGCPEEKIYYEENIEIVQVIYRCFEFTPIIYVAKNPDFYDFKYAFFTHDTVSFGSKFYELLKKDINILENKVNYYSGVPIEFSKPSMNIGIYNKLAILENKTRLNEITTYSNDKQDLFILKKKLGSSLTEKEGMNLEDFIINQRPFKKFKHYKSHRHWTFYHNEDGTKTNVLNRYYPAIDFTKYQSNWGCIKTINICDINNIK